MHVSGLDYLDHLCHDHNYDQNDCLVARSAHDFSNGRHSTMALELLVEIISFSEVNANSHSHFICTVLMYTYCQTMQNTLCKLPFCEDAGGIRYYPGVFSRGGQFACSCSRIRPKMEMSQLMMSYVICFRMFAWA